MSGEDRHFGDLYDRDVDEAAERAYRASQGLPPASTSRSSVPLERARFFAENIRAALLPACERLEIAGSIRRGVATVKDVELVAVPKGIPTDLFGKVLEDDRSELDVLVDGFVSEGLLEAREPRRMGLRYKALRAVRSGIALDLFIVRPPAEWGTIFAIRTGGADFSRFCVTKARERGRRVERGRVLEGTKVISTPTEEDFFRAVGVGFLPPESRS
jgi:DNA polymerase/3'-5' exonuclease PolX